MAAVGSSGAFTRRDDFFNSVFPRPSFTTPTPESTPNIGVVASPGETFGGFIADSPADEVVRLTRAWSAATRHLTLETVFVNPAQHDVCEAFQLLLENPVPRKDLAEWYMNEVTTHFRKHVVPELSIWNSSVAALDASNVLTATVNLLQTSQRHYLLRLDALSQSRGRDIHEQTSLEAFKDRVRHRLHVLVLNSIPLQRLHRTLASVFLHHMKVSLAANSNPEKCLKDGTCQCVVSLTALPLATLHEVGLGGNVGERAFALAVDAFIAGAAIERQCFQVDWSGQSTVVQSLQSWIQNCLAPLIERTLSLLTGNDTMGLTKSDTHQLVRMAITNIDRRRVQSLFDYVKAWPDSRGAILDIKECIARSSPGEKVQACAVFSSQIQERLLHAGASTTEILSIYVNVIHAFKLLDARGVLLEKVSGPIRSYLRARDDTASLIAVSFLADVDEEGAVVHADAAKVCADIAAEVARSPLVEGRDQRTLDWDDMNWVPDPIDAGPDYRSSKADDTLSYVLGLFEQEEFIKEITAVLAQHLLQADDYEYVKETRLIELLKARLDATKLQAAEVMLKDVRDSVTLNKRINKQAQYDVAKPPTPREVQDAIPIEGITMASLFKMFEQRVKQAHFMAMLKLVANRRDDLFFPKRRKLPQEPQENSDQTAAGGVDFKVAVLSSFFWPQMRSDDFKMPSGFADRQERFRASFGYLGTQRVLSFRPALAHVTVELELEDRTVREAEVPAWRASVIDEFTTERSAGDEDVIDHVMEYNPELGKTSEQLQEALEMPAELVTDALTYWMSKTVLYQKAPGRYAVLERLDMVTGSPQQQVQEHPDAVSAVISQESMLREGAAMFETFIANMLRNSGPKEVGGMMGITNMLKMVLPTFTYGEEEVRWLLGEMEGRGEIVRNAELWSVAG